MTGRGIAQGIKRASIVVQGIRRARMLTPGQVVARWLRHRSWNRGVLGDSSTWFTVFCVIAAVQFMLKILKKHNQVKVHSERLPAGSAIVIRHLHMDDD